MAKKPTRKPKPGKPAPRPPKPTIAGGGGMMGGY